MQGAINSMQTHYKTIKHTQVITKVHRSLMNTDKYIHGYIAVIDLSSFFTADRQSNNKIMETNI